MRNGGRHRIEETLREKPCPRRMNERFKVSTLAKGEGFRSRSIAAFIEAKEIDLMVAAQFPRQVINAMIRAAREWMGDVGINNEQTHGFYAGEAAGLFFDLRS